MKAKKQDKSVADMAVLRDIRGLLSATRELPAAAGESKTQTEASESSDKHRLEAQIKQLQERLDRQQALLDRLAVEKKDLETRMSELQSALPKTAAPKSHAPPAVQETSDLDARKAELEAGLSQIEELLQLKIRDLARRIARVYEEAGDMGANRDFRRITNQLEAADNFGEFLRALLR